MRRQNNNARIGRRSFGKSSLSGLLRSLNRSCNTPQRRQHDCSVPRRFYRSADHRAARTCGNDCVSNRLLSPIKMKREITALEIRQGRNLLRLEKVSAGPILASLHSGASFFYRVTLDGAMWCMTSDPSEAQTIWRGCMRWLRTGNSPHAHVLP